MLAEFLDQRFPVMMTAGENTIHASKTTSNNKQYILAHYSFLLLQDDDTTKHRIVIPLT